VVGSDSLAFVEVWRTEESLVDVASLGASEGQLEVVVTVIDASEGCGESIRVG
jgi:hypothetical protein